MLKNVKINKIFIMSIKFNFFNLDMYKKKNPNLRLL